ncbi:MAG: hypothetical protein E6Q97_33225 [Desulfurellales bacterium]|nr:MAG: hypothetical protein E6Q97_33225 [Desulfurellales bacterium]
MAKDKALFFGLDGWTQVETQDWLRTAVGTRRGARVISARGEAGPHAFSLAPGEGRNGRTALRMTLTDPNSSPDWYGILYDRHNPKPTASYANCTTCEGYTVPRGKLANRIHFWLKFPQGYRRAASANTMQNVHFGTYHCDPGLLSGSANCVESHGWHHYHQIVIRHDLAGNDWVHVCLNQSPTHVRSGSAIPATRDTLPSSDYYESLTRWYFSPVPYGLFGQPKQDGTPEIPAPFDVLIDDVYTDFVDERHPVEIQIENWPDGQWVEAAAGTLTEWTVRVSNTTDDSVSGVILLRHSGGYQLPSKLIAVGTSFSVSNTSITLAAGETRIYSMQFTPPASFAGRAYAVSIDFTPSSEEANGRLGSLVLSKADPRVGYSSAMKNVYLGPPDADVCTRQFVLSIVGSPPVDRFLPHSSEGGSTTNGIKNKLLVKQMDGCSLNGRAVSWQLVDYRARPDAEHLWGLNPGGLTLTTSGQLIYQPPVDFVGTVQVRFSLTDGVRTSRIFAHYLRIEN